MISVGSIDGRKKLELGSGMEETELEEGEARSCHSHGEGEGDGDGDSSVDPDFTLSYIGEKLQKCLGHLQKDFEGGVSAENLGAKYGGYGSFLPTYQRSPLLYQTISPAEVHNNGVARSPRKLKFEDQRQKPFASVRSGDASGKAVSGEHSLKSKGNVQSYHVEGAIFKGESTKKKSVDSSNQRTLKVRIKVGSENLLTQRNAELYNGLGLVVSPSSSLDVSPETSDDSCDKHFNVPGESPTSILEIMTSYPGERHLSPLPEDLIHLTEEMKLAVNCETNHMDKMGMKNFAVLENGFHSSKSNYKVLDLKKSKSYGEDDCSPMELVSQKSNGDRDSSYSLIKENDIDINTSGCEELVTNALKLPFLLSSQQGISDPAKNVPSETMLPPTVLKEGVKSDIASDIVAFSQEEAPKAEKSHDLEYPQSNASEGRKAPNALGPSRPTKQLLKGEPADEEESKSPLEKSSTGGKRRQNDEAIVKCSLPQRGGRSNHTNFIGSNNDSHHLQDDHQKAGGRYKDSFGDAAFEDNDNDNGKRSEKPPKKEIHPRVNSLPVSCLENKLNTEAPRGSIPLDGEFWVCCDKCRKWRLLPPGKVPKSTSNEWFCRMLNWLPGMNRCSIPQDETTSAVRALYQSAASVPDTIVTSAGAVQIDGKSPCYEPLSAAVQTAAIGGKKENSADFDGPARSPNPSKKVLATSDKRSSWNSQNSSPALERSGDQQKAQLSAVPKYNDTKEEKISVTNGSDGNLKIKNKRETDIEGSRAHKRIKTEELHADDEKLNSDNGRFTSKGGCGSNSMSNNGTSRSNRHRYSDHKDTNDGAKKTSNAEKHVPANSEDLLHSEKNGEESFSKRKAREPYGSLIHSEPISSSGRHHPVSGDLVDELQHQKEKKVRVSKSEGRDPIGNKTSVGSDRKNKETKDQHNGKYLSNHQAAGCLKSDMGAGQPLLATNSGSSKGSGSHKNMINGQELKGSPVESVSSSPLKPSNAVKVASNGKSPNGKEDDEDEERNEKMRMVKEETIVSLSDHAIDGDNDKLCQRNKNDNRKQTFDQCKVEENSHDDHNRNGGCHVKKTGKELFSHCKDKVNIKVSDLHEEKLNGRRSKSDEKCDNPSKSEKVVSQNDNPGTSRESSRDQGQKKCDPDRQEPETSRDKKHNIQRENNEKLPSKRNQTEVCVSGKPNSLPPLARVQSAAVDGCDDGNALKAQSQRKRAENKGGQPRRHPTPNSHKVRDGEAPSPHRRESFSHAVNNVLKDAKDLKHAADRLKNSGSTESNGVYFQAALKFLRGASLLESGSSEAATHSELMHSMSIYSSTAKLCEFCAREFERSKDMAAAALAYKCMEVAYMRVVYSSHAVASKDRHHLNRALQSVPSGESPSSSASDVDNLNHRATTDKAASAKPVGSPQVSGNHVITSQNRTYLSRILNFAQDVNLAMEASRKSRIAFTDATSRLGETSNNDEISR
ncbi:cysteine-tryptophan domain-containing zinc finger protein 3-like isoform X2 [Andrographis paniculata]|uniref:cysteine-tryptophan domain-containing zinc finger protein 3-like isoform X2 n=1 Tax=Andrographis paniculata TaxID=175694 RepID=UPI0021E90AF0|nr:cysteine-tryptophan domain-containing zinc finger protein 3-like isoform X2 [Andrographis paniculata]